MCCVGGGGHGHAVAVECEMECDEHGSGGAGGISQTTPELDCRVSLTHFTISLMWNIDINRLMWGLKKRQNY